RLVFADGARTLPVTLRRAVGRRVDLRSDARRLADGPLVVARLLLRQSAVRRHCGGGDPLRIPEYEAAPHRSRPGLGRICDAHRLDRAATARADVGDAVRL